MQSGDDEDERLRPGAAGRAVEQRLSRRLEMRISIALSGGGFRAALFHLGVLRRAAELGWLPKVEAISGVSGGSIVAAFAALRWSEMISEGGDPAAFEKHVVAPFLTVVTKRNILREWL